MYKTLTSCMQVYNIETFIHNGISSRRSLVSGTSWLSAISVRAPHPHPNPPPDNSKWSPSPQDQYHCHMLSDISTSMIALCVTSEHRALWCSYSVMTQSDFPGSETICRQGLPSASKCRRQMSRFRSWVTDAQFGSCVQYQRHVWLVDWGRGNSRESGETPSVSL